MSHPERRGAMRSTQGRGAIGFAGGTGLAAMCAVQAPKEIVLGVAFVGVLALNGCMIDDETRSRFPFLADPAR